MSSPVLNLWHRVRFGVFVGAVSLMLLYLRYGRADITERLALWGSDLVVKLSPQDQSHNVAIVEITDTDTAAHGQWPWPRRDLARLVERLRTAGASVIVFTDVFSDDDLAQTDGDFASTILDNGVILAREVTDQTVNNPVDSIATAAAAVGSVTPVVDPDGVVRRMPLVKVVNDRAYYNIGVETIRTLTGDYGAKIKYQDNGYTVSLNGLAPWRVHNDSGWRLKFNHTFDRIPATSKDFGAVKNKIVLVGAATRAVNNWVTTPLGAIRNQQLQAEMLESLFEHANVVTPPWADLLEMAVSVLVLISIVSAIKAHTPYASIPAWLGGVGVMMLGSWILFNVSNWSLDWVWPTLICTSVFLITFYYHLAMSRRTAWIVSKRFGGNVSGEMLKKIQKRYSKIKTTGEQREITVLYADLRGFANLAAQHAGNAEGLVTTVHNYMNQILPAVTRNGGTVDKLIGDGIVAFWNAPLDQHNHAQMAVKAAHEMLAQIVNINVSSDNTNLCLDIGINTGPAVVGNTGSKKKFNYTAMGDSVRTADILENYCKQMGVNLLVGEQTAQQIALHYKTLELDTISQETGNAMRMYAVFDKTQVVTDEQTHAQMLASYYANDYDTALRLCRQLRPNAVLSQYYRAMADKIRMAKLNQMEENV